MTDRWFRTHSQRTALILKELILKKSTKKTGSVSQAIRDYAAANPTLGPTKISQDLQAQGINAYPALVSQALREKKSGKSSIRKSSNRKSRGRPAKSAASAPASQDYVAVITSAAEFVKTSGGIEEAMQALKAFQKISSVLDKN